MFDFPTLSPQKTKIGFIGTGVMGSPMASHLQKGGYQLLVYTRTKEKAEELLAQGAQWRTSPAEVARDAHIVFTIVGFPDDVREVYFGEEGILEEVTENMILCDMTTGQPTLAQEIAKKAQARGAASLDAPVSGGDTGAREGTLAVMVGGPEKAFNYLLPLFQFMGENIVYCGSAGAGQHTKMVNQIVIAGTMMGMIEGLRYGEHAGLDLNTVLEAIQDGAAGSWSLDNLAPRIVKRNFGPGFYLKHFVKDMEIAKDEARQMHLKLPVLKKALTYYRRAKQEGYGEYGTHGLYKAWKEHPQWG